MTQQMPDRPEFIPMETLLNATADQLALWIPGWRVIETVQTLPSALPETEEASA